MKKFNRILSVFLAVITVLSCTVITAAANITFTDVANHWAWTNGQIPYLVEKGVLNGYKNDNGTYYFKPDGEVTRAEFIKILDETFGLTKTTSINYNDIKSSDWYQPYFAKAAAQGYILNYGNNASPNTKISRQEATALLVRYLDLPASSSASSSAITDFSDISSYYSEYVLRAIDAGIINGYSENGKTYFKPTKTLSRAEALTILYRAAGCIYNTSAYNRDSGAYSANNTITRGDITISNITMTGRNIVTEGASSGTVTFSKCKINGTLYIRGGANVTFDNCEVEDVIALGGGKISVVSGTEIDSLTIEKTCEISVLSNTEVEEITVKNGADNVKVTGNGKIESAYIYADGFSSAMIPEEFEIGNNLTASFGGTNYSGDSDTQSSFTIEPFVTADKNYYYINLESSVSGTVYYYFTNSATAPSISAFSSSYAAASHGNSFSVEANEPTTKETYSVANVKNYSYVVVQLQDGSKKYPVYIADNSLASAENGFETTPYLASSNTVKYKTSMPGTVYWYYAENGSALTQIEFLSEYEKQSSALKGEDTVGVISNGTVSLKDNYLKNYSYLAFMVKSSSGTYYTPVILSMGDNGFTDAPALKTAGVVTYKASVNGDLYYYYSENSNLPTAADFKSEYNAAKYSDKTTVKKGVSSELRYKTSYIDDYPYLVIAIKNSDGEYMQPVSVNINLTTGFRNEPELDDDNTISFRTEEYGKVEYYYTKTNSAPSIDEFTKNYEAAQSKYKGSVNCSTTYTSVTYKTAYIESYPYMALRFTDDDGNVYSPVLVSLKNDSDNGFKVLPYAKDGKIYFITTADGEVLYFYSRDDSNVSADDFLDWYEDVSSSKRGSVTVSAGVAASFEYDEDLIDRYPYIIIAYRDGDSRSDDIYTPYILDIEESGKTNAGSGFTITGPDSDGDYKVTAMYDGKLYYYRTDKKSALPTSASDFEDLYDSANSSSSKNLDKGDNHYIETDDYAYVVVAFKVDGEFLPYVIIDTEKGTTGSEGGSSSFDDGSNKSGYGFSVLSYSDDEVLVSPDHDGTISMLIVISGSVTNYAQYDCTEDKTCRVTIPSFGGFGDLFKNNTDFYIQLTDSNGNIYQAYKLTVN